MTYHVYKFPFVSKVNLAPYIFQQIHQIQSKTPFTVNKKYNFNYLTTTTFGFIDFKLRMNDPYPKNIIVLSKWLWMSFRPKVS